MTRDDFMARLRRGLAGAPAATIADIAADYDTHFADGAAAARALSPPAGCLAPRAAAPIGLTRSPQRPPASPRPATTGSAAGAQLKRPP